jgi:hypothetical protein
LPKLATLFVEFDPHDFSFNLIWEEFHARIAENRARDKRSEAVDEKSYERGGEIDKE